MMNAMVLFVIVSFTLHDWIRYSWLLLCQLLSKNTCSALDWTQVKHGIYYLIFNKQTRREDKRAKQNKANMLFYWMQIRFQIWKTFKKNFRCLWPKITSAPLYLYKKRGEWRVKRMHEKSEKKEEEKHSICIWFVNINFAHANIPNEVKILTKRCFPVQFQFEEVSL